MNNVLPIVRHEPGRLFEALGGGRAVPYVPSTAHEARMAYARELAVLRNRNRFLEDALFKALQEKEATTPPPARLPADPRKDLPHFAGVFEPGWDPVIEPKGDVVAEALMAAIYFAVLSGLAWGAVWLARVWWAAS